MLHLEFAVAPSQINSLMDLVILEARMGYEKGAVLSRFPKAWFREVSQQLNAELDGTKLDRATEKLRTLQSSKLVSFGRSFDGEGWVEAARNSHDAKLFHRLVEDSFDDRPVFVPSLIDLEDADFAYVSFYTREAESLASAASGLLFGAEKVTIYDPYICATNAGSRKTLLELMKLCKKGEVEFHIFSEEDKKPAWDLTEQALVEFKDVMPENTKLYWYCADDQGSGFLHSRGLFTAKGGLIYDRGFSEPGAIEQRQELTEIIPMPIDVLQAKAKSYNTSLQYENFELVRGVWSSHP
ncbi:hypothetical protein ACWOKN_003143 [Vibrio vulnificus]|uniref:hypothetical protein n=1 Tax=Vibrio vulnificus TaxID=672 RepID=UPI000DAEE453|nr:hypothetical protein [Vibrio vulnificus]EGQ8027528.1 hypothetical protein [Vibrio vulnificus]EIZ1351233.1 hypothetical protein [Vibrio vulnificus]EJE8733683.1 hypothetical protein [Vibrio vulnificus]ELG5190935.1 hypothetical protein [Vibrio vulnificus]ELH4810848.1 hypothetical protein [Vibrio vulnificus]